MNGPHKSFTSAVWPMPEPTPRCDAMKDFLEYPRFEVMKLARCLERERNNFEREADALRIGNGHLRDKLEEMTGWRNECGFRYNREKEKTAKLRAALADCLLMSPLNPFERGEMIQRVLDETK